MLRELVKSSTGTERENEGKGNQNTLINQWLVTNIKVNCYLFSWQKSFLSLISNGS